MLKINTSKVNFNKRIILKNVYIEAKSGYITTITGDSGTGKSTIVDILTFRKEMYMHYEIFDTCFDTFSNDEKQNYLFNFIGVVYQNPKLLRDLTISEHIDLIKEITQTNKDITEFIDKLELKELMPKYPNELSGGERVRASILFSLVKDPKVIILDEPTSSLDDYYAIKVIELLRGLLDDDKIIIITSHDKKIIDASDRIYLINHNMLELQKTENIQYNKDLPVTMNLTTPTIKTVKNFFKLFNKHMKLHKKIILVLTIICIGTSSFFIEFNNIATDSQVQAINELSSNELTIYKPSGGYPNNEGVENGEANDVIFQEEIQKLKKLSNVKEIKWRLDLWLGGFLSLADSPLYYSPSKDNLINTYKMSVGLNDGNIIEKIIERSSLPTLNTYYKNKDYHDQIACDFGVKGVYISKYLAKLFVDDIESLKGSSIQFNLPVPIYNSDGKAWGVSDNDVTYNQNLTSCEWVSVKIPIAGVLQSSSMGITNYFNYAIYIEQSEIEKYINKYKATSGRTVYIYGKDIHTCQVSINKKPPISEEIFLTVQDEIWTPKNYSVFVNDITQINEVIRELNKMGFNVSNKYFESTIALDTIKSMQKSIRYMTLAITFIILLGYIIIKLTDCRGQQSISEYFYRLGFTKNQIIKLKKSIYFHSFLVLTLFSSLSLVIVLVIVNNVLKIGYTGMRLSMFALIVLLSFIIEYIVPTFFEKKYLKKW